MRVANEIIVIHFEYQISFKNAQLFIGLQRTLRNETAVRNISYFAHYNLFHVIISMSLGFN